MPFPRNASADRRRLGIAILVVALFMCVVAWLEADNRTWSLWENTAQLSAAVGLVAVPVGTFLAMLIHRTDARGGRWVWSVLVTLLFIPLYLQAAAWDAWFGRQGWIWPAQDFVSRRMTAAVFIHSAAAIPWVAVIVGAGLRQIDPELEESAWLQMSPLAVLGRVTLPLSAPAILAAAWWVVAMTTSEITVTDIYQVRTYAEEVYTTIPLLDTTADSATGSATLPRGFWTVASCLAIALAAIAWNARHDFRPGVRRPLQLELVRWRTPLTVIMVLIVTLLAAVPLGNLVGDAGQQAERVHGDVVQRWSGVKCISMIASSPWHFRREMLWTTVIAGCAASVTLMAAIPLAWLARRRSWAATPAWISASAAAAVPGPIVALGLISLLNRADSDLCVWLYDRTILAPVLAASIRAWPVTVLVSWWACRTLPEELVDAANIDGLGWFGKMRHVLWPLRRNLFLAAWLAAFAVSVGDLSASILVTPPGISTLSVRIFGLLHAGVDDQVAGMCLMIALISVIIAVLAIRFFSRDRDIASP